jgi:hypothetical protein
MANYADQTSVEGVLGRPLTATEIAALPALLAAVDAYINKTIGRTFGVADEQVTRYYDVERSRMLDVDPFVVDDDHPFELFYVDADENSQGAVNTSDYEARPRNETVKTWLQRRSGTWGSGCPSNVTNIALKAYFGAGDVPADIQYAASWLAANAFGSTASLSLKSESIEGYSRTFADGTKSNNQIQAIFDNYFEVLL